MTSDDDLHSLASMQLLKKVNDPVSLQILSDVLEQQQIEFLVENIGMNALMPLPGIIEARVIVAEGDLERARQVLIDLEMEG